MTLWMFILTMKQKQPRKTTEKTAITFEDSDTESEDLDDKFQAYMGAETRGRYTKDSE